MRQFLTSAAGVRWEFRAAEDSEDQTSPSLLLSSPKSPTRSQPWLPATVPGCVHTDLIAHGLADPFVGTNESSTRWVSEQNYDYRCLPFPIDTAVTRGADSIDLILTGVDTLASVYLCGEHLGDIDNAFRTWTWDVKSILSKRTHADLLIRFRSPVKYVAQMQANMRMFDMPMGIRGGVHMRKPPYSFGWDWGPALPSMGLTHPLIAIEGRSVGKLVDVRFGQLHEIEEVRRRERSDGCVTVCVRVQVDALGKNGKGMSLRFELWDPDGTQLADSSQPVVFEEKNLDSGLVVLRAQVMRPRLWFPNGLGDQPLYKVKLELLWERLVVDSAEYNIGLRTARLEQAPTQSGGRSFMFSVNEIPLFSMGSNWIPTDAFITRTTNLEYLVRSAVEGNQNMLRVWGGGYYESEEFYDLCDKHGIMVWQDFMFACAAIPLHQKSYADSAEAEIADHIRRLRHRPSLVIYCGNNEVEQMAKMFNFYKRMGTLGKQVQDAYYEFFYRRLVDLVRREDGSWFDGFAFAPRPYWPSSPCSYNGFVPRMAEPSNLETIGDAHLWDVYHGLRLPGYYMKQNHRFVSEFGFQSLPALDTIRHFAMESEAEWNEAVSSSLTVTNIGVGTGTTTSLTTHSFLTDPVMLSHQKAPAGNYKLLFYISTRFRIPFSFERFVHLSQVYQAECIRIGVEHWRRQPQQTSGALYWQLNDAWPVISWSSIDYFGRWKALHFAMKRSFAPVAISVVLSGPVVGMFGERKAEIWMANETGKPVRGRLMWSLEKLDGTVLTSAAVDLEETDPVELAQKVAEAKFGRTFDGRVVDWLDAVFLVWSDSGDLKSMNPIATLFHTEKSTAKVYDDPGLKVDKVEEVKDIEIIQHTFSRVGDRIQDRPTRFRCFQIELRASRSLARFVELRLDIGDSAAEQQVPKVHFSDNFVDVPGGGDHPVIVDMLIEMDKNGTSWTCERVREQLRFQMLNCPATEMSSSMWTTLGVLPWALGKVLVQLVAGVVS
ncbi:glycoside hydrolase superfamily [Cladochytrium replicatum]|nr:glycoside hydrolase superfamily [Cladochytrium replicatum]